MLKKAMPLFLLLSCVISCKVPSSTIQAPNKLYLVLAFQLNEDCSIKTAFANRLDLAFDLYQKEMHPILITGGGVCKVKEAIAGEQYLVKKGIPPEDIWIEKASMTTIENAYFTLTAHILPAKITHVTLITNKFHMPRSRWVFERFWPKELNINLSFETAANSTDTETDWEAYEAGDKLLVEKCYEILFKDEVKNWDLQGLQKILRQKSLKNYKKYAACRAEVRPFNANNEGK